METTAIQRCSWSGAYTQTLKNSIATDRIHHAYLFSGPRGVGKTTTARILARVINCSDPKDSEPCNKCDSCNAILEAKSLDVIEIDGASNNSVDDIRKLRENAKYPPSVGNKKMYIIDEVHMLSTAAFNALLKILEEPPPHLMFVFATTEQHKVPATILSRCQRHEFKRIETTVIIDQLRQIATSEAITIDEDSLVTIANKADGSMRDAQSVFDQVIAFAGTNIGYSDMIDALHLIDADFYFNISTAGVNGKLDDMFLLSKEIISKGYDLQEVLSGLIEHYRNLLTIKVTGNTHLINASDTFRKKYSTNAEAFTKADLLRILNLLSLSEQSIRFSSQPKIKFELTLIQLASLDTAIEITDLINEIRNQGSGLKNITNKPQVSVAREAAKNYDIHKKSVITPPKSINNEKEKVDSANLIIDDTRISHNENEDTDKNLGNRWPEFISKFSAKEGLTFLKSTVNVFTENEIIVYTSTEFIYDNLKNKKAIISDRLEEFYGRRINLKIVLDVTKSFENLNSQTDINNKEKESNSSLSLTDEGNEQLPSFDKKIIEKFNARRINRKQD